MPEDNGRRPQRFRKEFIRRIFDLSLAAFGLVAALAWNDAIQEFVRRYIPEGSTILAKFTYAIVVTLLAVLATIQLGTLAARLGSNDDNDAKK